MIKATNSLAESRDVVKVAAGVEVGEAILLCDVVIVVEAFIWGERRWLERATLYRCTRGSIGGTAVKEGSRQKKERGCSLMT